MHNTSPSDPSVPIHTAGATCPAAPIAVEQRILALDVLRGFYAKMAVTGFLIGLPIVGFGVWRNHTASWNMRYSFFFGAQYNYWGAVIVDMGWIGVLMSLCNWSGLPRLKAALGAVGRTAFSNYILPTLICTTLFYGHGFGLYGSVSRVGQILIVLPIWIVQLVVSPLWLRHFAFGPLEWLWRSLTYWRGNLGTQYLSMIARKPSDP